MKKGMPQKKPAFVDDKAHELMVKEVYCEKFLQEFWLKSLK